MKSIDFYREPREYSTQPARIPKKYCKKGKGAHAFALIKVRKIECREIPKGMQKGYRYSVPSIHIQHFYACTICGKKKRDVWYIENTEARNE